MKMFLIQIFLCPVAGWKSTWSLLCQLEKKFATQKESAHLSDISQVGGNKLFSKLLKTLFASLLLLPHSPCLTKKHCITTICDGLLCSVYEYKGTWFQQKEMLKSTWRRVFLWWALNRLLGSGNWHEHFIPLQPRFLPSVPVFLKLPL